MRFGFVFNLVVLICVALPSWAAAPSTTQPSSDYQLQPGDVVKIQVFQEPDLDRELRVSQDGQIALPMIGSIEVKNRTLSVVEKTVRELYDRDYLVNPQVNITVLTYQKRSVNVMGAVNAPQAIEYPPEQTLTILDAISRAGGFNRFADRKKVLLTRTFADGHSEKYTVNADQLISGATTEHWVLIKDDVIFVPESVL
jgi:polysaccharide export outer membrane protein